MVSPTSTNKRDANHFWTCFYTSLFTHPGNPSPSSLPLDTTFWNLCSSLLRSIVTHFFIERFTPFISTNYRIKTAAAGFEATQFDFDISLAVNPRLWYPFLGNPRNDICIVFFEISHFSFTIIIKFFSSQNRVTQISSSNSVILKTYD